jgi:hypothetical protein
MCGRVRSIVIGRHSTFLELKARMFGQQGGRILLFKTAVGGSKTRLHDTQHIGDHTDDQDFISAIEKVEGGGKAKRSDPTGTRKKERLILMKARAEERILKQPTLDDAKRLVKKAIGLMKEPDDCVRRRIEELNYHELQEFDELIKTFDTVGSSKRASDFHSFAIGFFFPDYKALLKVATEMDEALRSLASAFEFKFGQSFMTDGGSIVMENIKSVVEDRKKALSIQNDTMTEEQRIQQMATQMAQQMAADMLRHHQLNGPPHPDVAMAT